MRKLVEWLEILEVPTSQSQLQMDQHDTKSDPCNKVDASNASATVRTTPMVCEFVVYNSLNKCNDCNMDYFLSRYHSGLPVEEASAPVPNDVAPLSMLNAVLAGLEVLKAGADARFEIYSA